MSRHWWETSTTIAEEPALAEPSPTSTPLPTTQIGLVEVVDLTTDNPMMSAEWAWEVLKCKPDLTSNAWMSSCLSMSWDVLITHSMTVDQQTCRMELRMRWVPWGDFMAATGAPYSVQPLSMWERKLGTFCSGDCSIFWRVVGMSSQSIAQIIWACSDYPQT